MEITTIRTGSTLVSSAVPDRSAHRSPIAYTGLFQRRSKRISLPVKCFYVSVAGHHFLVDTGWSEEVAAHPIRHLGFALWFASEPVMREEEAAVNQLRGKPIDAVLMTHLDSDHVSGLRDLRGVPVHAAPDEVGAASEQRVRYGRLAEGLEFEAIGFEDDREAPFGKAADVFGDGSVTAFLIPTHSAGSVIYKISDGDAFALMVGDNGYMADSWERGILPGPLYDAENMRECLEWIRNRSHDENCRGVYCAHDPLDR